VHLFLANDEERKLNKADIESINIGLVTEGSDNEYRGWNFNITRDHIYHNDPNQWWGAWSDRNGASTLFDFYYGPVCWAHPADVFFGIIVQFDNQGYVQGYKIRAGLAFGGATKGALDIIYNLRETCTKIVQVASTSENEAWSARVNKDSTYRVPSLLYSYAKDYAPYGGMVVPAGLPEDWRRSAHTGPIEAVLSADMMLARATSPYSCVTGACGGSVSGVTRCSLGDHWCVNDTETAACTNEVDSNGNHGYCRGLGVGFCENKTNKTCQYNSDCGDDEGPCHVFNFSNDRNWTVGLQKIQQLFIKVYEAWAWDDALGAYVSNQSGNPTASAVYSQAFQSWNTMIVCKNPRDNGSLFLCANQPTATQITVGDNGATSVEINGTQLVQLNFEVRGDAQQLPIRFIDISWTGDDLDVTRLPGPLNNGPIIISHLYNHPGTYYPRIQIMDNWEFCSNTSYAGRDPQTRNETCDANKDNWKPMGVTVLVKQ
jgi:hypothetical protein